MIYFIVIQFDNNYFQILLRENMNELIFYCNKIFKVNNYNFLIINVCIYESIYNNMYLVRSKYLVKYFSL